MVTSYKLSDQKPIDKDQGVGILVRKKRMIIGVVAAEANSIEQRQIIKGIARFDQCVGSDTIVFSNNYNPTSAKRSFSAKTGSMTSFFPTSSTGLSLFPNRL